MISEHPFQLNLNQSSLQDFIDCPRRFELRSINDALWPAAPAAPLSNYESLTEIGNQFHQLCQQFFLGVDTDHILSTISHPEVRNLWESFLPYATTLSGFPNYSEQILRMPYKGHFLVAKFDLIAQKSDNDFYIIDWKTSARKPSRDTLAHKVQTMLYPFIFQQAGVDLFRIDEIPPSSIKMIYFYPLSSDPEELFPYSESVHLEGTQKISELITEIEALIQSSQTFPLTEDHQRCKYCVYRSFCERGSPANPIPAGADLESEDLSNAHFDLDLINEIEF